MTEKEYLKWEKEAIERGYRKYNTGLSNDYSYFKIIGETDKGYRYIIEWMVWDWRKHITQNIATANSPYSLEVNIIPDSIKNDMRLDMLVGDPLKFGFDKIEKIAESYHKFLIAEGVATTKSETK